MSGSYFCFFSQRFPSGRRTHSQEEPGGGLGGLLGPLEVEAEVLGSLVGITESPSREQFQPL